MSVKNIGTNRWRVIAKEGIDPKTGKVKYCDTTIKGTRDDAKRLEAEHTLFDRELFSSLPLRDYAEAKWLPAIAKELASNTLCFYEGNLRRYVYGKLGHVRMFELTTGVCKAWMQELPDAGKVPARKTLSSLLSFAAEDGVIQVNPMALLRRTTKRSKGQKRRRKPYVTLTQEDCIEFQRVIEGTCIEALCLVMLNAGARREEACALDWEMFDWEAQTAPVEQAYVVVSGTGRCEMKDPKNDESWRDLRFAGYAADRLYELSIGQSGPICKDREGARMRPDDANDLFKAVMELYRFPRMTIGHLRHTFATQHLLAGTDVARLRDLMGHSSVSTIIDEYLIPMGADLDDAQVCLAERFDPRTAADARA